MTDMPPQRPSTPPIPEPIEIPAPANTPQSTPPAAQPTGDATGGIIPYKNVSALIAYYLGVFSIIPCFPLGLVAFFLGLQGLKYSKQHPEAKGAAHAWIGIVAGGLFGFGWLLFTGFIFFSILFSG